VPIPQPVTPRTGGSADTAPSEMVPAGLELEGLVLDPVGATIRLKAVSATAGCPACGGRSRRVHSRYVREVADLPWHGVPVVLRVRARRFFCDGVSCGRRSASTALTEEEMAALGAAA
jgi:transposase